MAKASDNEYPSVLFGEQASTPTTPGAGTVRFFFDNTGTPVPKYVDDAGTVTTISTGGGGGSAAVVLLDNASVGTGTSFTITGIATGYEYLRLFVASRTDRSGQNHEGFHLQVGDGSIDTTSGNYAYGMQYQGSSSGILRSGADTKIRSNAAAIGGAGGAAELGHAEYTILNYDDAAEHTQFIFQTGMANSGAQFLIYGNGSYLVANTVDQIRITTENATNFTRGEYWLVGVL